jgi:Family of unknown function (DUF716)
MDTMELSSTFEGHVLPGSMFLIWALYWIVQRFVRRGAVPGQMLESGLFLPVAKIVLPLVGVWVEIPGQGWYPGDVMMSWEHVTMYAVFCLCGVVDLLARRGALAPASTYVAYAAAQANAGFLFWGHSAHGGVEGLVHAHLSMVFFAVAGLAIVEMLRPSAGLAWARIGAQLMLGTWFIVGGWILYRSGWDLNAPFREGWSYMVFSWTTVTISVLTVAARILDRRRIESRPTS